MKTPAPAQISRRVVLGGLAIAAIVGLYFVPLFHVLPLEATRSAAEVDAFDASDFVEALWDDSLPGAIDGAVDAAELIAALQSDSTAAAEQYGHRLGLAGSSNYFVSGGGTISSVEGNTIAISVQDGVAATVVIKMGPVFANSIRDGSGLLDVNDFANSREFNEISSEINRRVEERVFPLLEENAAVGRAVRFVGGVEMADTETDLSTLELVPVLVEFP